MISRSINVIAVLCLFVFPSFSQEEQAPENIEGVFDQLMIDYATWDIYKVVPVTTLESFGKALKDSVGKKDANILELKKDIDAKASKIASLEENAASLTLELEQSNAKNDEITFLGIPLSKTLYQVIVWSLIIGLFLLAIFAYMLFLRSNKVTSQYKKDIEATQKELEDQRTKAHENQLKLKRQLQTAENLINEKGIRN
ncbi:MAG: hypothetical protein JXR03_12980 [Cyclobacteriaceae bacterium]